MMIVMVLLLLLGALLVRPLRASADEFSGHTLDGAWAFSNRTEVYPLPVTAHDRQAVDADRGIKLLREPPTGDWAVSVRLVGGDAFGQSGVQTGLVLYADGANWMHFGPVDGLAMGTEEGHASAGFASFAESVRPYGQIVDIRRFEEVCVLTGERGINETETRWNWGSGDLGSMFEVDGTVYMLFGDTFAGNNQAGRWMHNSIARIGEGDFTEGLAFDWLYAGSGGLVTPRPRSDDMSMIPVYGFGLEQDGVQTLYMYVMEIRNWGSGGHWDCNGGAWAVSTDGGWSFRLQPQLFAGSSQFIQLALWQTEEELYMLGTTGGGFGTVCLAKVPLDAVLDRGAYRFFTGTDAQGVPVWSEEEMEAVPVIESVNREIAVTYNAYLGVYLMTTLDNVSQQMVLREAPELWGPWSSPYVLFDEEYIENQSDNRAFYGSYMLPRYMENGGEAVYMTLNKWVPYQISWMRVVFEKAEER